MNAPILYWIRRDLRTSDNAALSYAVASGRAVIPVFILDSIFAAYGAAPRWRLGLGLEHLDKSYRALGAKLIFRSGEALSVLETLISETGADSVVWNRLYEPQTRARDKNIKENLKIKGLDIRSFPGMLMFEPWTVETGGGTFYKVYTPFWKSVRQREVADILEAPKSILSPERWPVTEELSAWNLGGGMERGADVVRPYVRIGESAAQLRLWEFVSNDIHDYVKQRDIPYISATSGLSENLAMGELSPGQCWHAARVAFQQGDKGAETFIKELVWREFAYHLMFHTPHLLTKNWKPDWDYFPWQTDERSPYVLAWKRGRTGVPFVDAAMREMYVTGRMHNRGRMIVASYLTKHLLCHWQIGQKWFENCLVDWDPANNAMGWQWSAGSGPDATPYFRVFNAETQLQKFDPEHRYIQQWIAELTDKPSKTALKFFKAIPKDWQLNAEMVYCEAIVTMSEGRQRALAAYKDRSF